jgi:hypothetical protein
VINISFPQVRSRFGSLQATSALDTSTVKLREGPNTLQVYSVPVGSTARTLVQTITVVRGTVVGAASTLPVVTSSGSSSSNDDNAAAIGGGIGGGIAALLLIGAISYFVVRARKETSQPKIIPSSSSSGSRSSSLNDSDPDYYDYESSLSSSDQNSVAPEDEYI